MADYQGHFAGAAGPDLLHAIHTEGREQRFTRGEKIQAAGTTLHPEGPILVIESGFMSTVAITASGQYTLLSIHGPGDLVGDHGLFGNTSETYGLAVTGMSNGSARQVRQERFRQILHDYPQGWEVLARHQHDRVAAAEERICLMASEPASRRLAVFLLQLLAYDESARAPGDRAQKVPLPLSQTQLAEWIGVSRETIERVLRGWVRDGMVETGRRTLLIRDVLHLQKIADGWRPFS
jgi:CRP/FNR family transcriptional regulator, cyclic AMP receptor protein